VSASLPGTCHTRISVSPQCTGSDATSSPTASARRYVESGGVCANTTVFFPPSRGTIFSTGLLLSTVLAWAVVTERPKRAFMAGSSKHGKKRRASAASSCVKAYFRSPARAA